MKKNHLPVICLTLLTFLISNVDAAPARTGKKARAVKVVDYDDSEDEAPASTFKRPWKENNWYLFGGLDLGFGQYGAFTPATEGSRSGPDGGVRVLLARYWKKWIVDGGAGYRYLSNSGKNADTTETKVTSRIGYLDLSPRYRLSQNWQIGPEFQYWLTGDNGLNPNPNSTEKNTSAWIGLQGMYEWMNDDTKYRFGARWQTPVNVEGRSVHIVQAFFQFGFSVFDSSSNEEEYPRRRNEQLSDRDLENAEAYTAPADPLPIATPWPVAPDPTPWPTPEMPVVAPTLSYNRANGKVDEPLIVRPSVFRDNGVPVTSCYADPTLPAWATLDTTNCVVTGTPTGVMAPAVYNITATNESGQTATAQLVLSVGAGKPKPQERVVLTLDVNDLPFDFDSARLPKYASDRVREVGRFLGENKAKWRQLEVEGHTDERGSNAYNDKLSKARAETVKQLLSEGGAPGGKIKAIGYGERRPKVKGSNEKAWSKNRRVELVFRGVKDVVIIRDALNKH